MEPSADRQNLLDNIDTEAQGFYCPECGKGDGDTAACCEDCFLPSPEEVEAGLRKAVTEQQASLKVRYTLDQERGEDD